MNTTLPLQGLKVIDCSTMLAAPGPLCTWVIMVLR